MNEIVTDLLGQPISAASVVMKARRPKKHGYASAPGSGPQGETCKSCANYRRVKSGTRAYPKCVLVKWTHGPGTDIKASSPACSRWEAKTAKQ